MVAITATAEPNNQPPRVALSIDFTSLTPDPTTATILRNDLDGRQRPVRLAEPATLVAGLWAGYDYECPFGTAVTYEAASTSPVGAVTSSPVTLDVAVVWLRHPGVPSLSAVVDIADKASDAATIDRAVFQPLGRQYPIVLSGARRADESSITLNAWTAGEEAALRAILNDGAVLLLTENAGLGLGNMYLSVGDIDIARPGAGTEAVRVFTLPYAVVDRPEGGLQAQFTYADVLAGHVDYAAVRHVFDDYADLLANRRNDA